MCNTQQIFVIEPTQRRRRTSKLKTDFQQIPFLSHFKLTTLLDPHAIQHSVNNQFHVHLPILINPLTPKDPYSGRTAPLTSKRCILYIYSTNICTEYSKHGIYCPFLFSVQNAVCFIILTYLVPVLFTFYIQSVLKFKK